MRLKRIIGILLIIGGIGTIGYAFASRIYYDNINKELVKIYEAEYSEETTDLYSGGFSEPESKTEQENDFSGLPVNVIGTIKIEKIELYAAVSQGSDYDTIKYSVGHFENTPLPGEKGNFCILGHRSSTYGRFFNRVGELEKGDLIDINIGGINYSYEIYDIYETDPSDVGVLEDSGKDEITIVTCTIDGKNRVIVKGNKI